MWRCSRNALRTSHWWCPQAIPLGPQADRRRKAAREIAKSPKFGEQPCIWTNTVPRKESSATRPCLHERAIEDAKLEPFAGVTGSGRGAAQSGTEDFRLPIVEYQTRNVAEGIEAASQQVSTAVR